MPLTAATALVASLSISGVPLFNGFASKWTIYVATVQGSRQAGYLCVCAAVAILTSALTLASFVKFFGASFLARTSALVKEKAGRGRLEVGLMMQIPQVLLALLCLLLGMAPAIAYGLIHRALVASPRGFGQALGDASPAPANLWAGLSGVQSRWRPSWAWPFLPLSLFPSSAARRAAPRLPGFAVTRAKPSATVTSRTAITARSNATFAGWAARPCGRRRNPPD
jgi:NADH:ubiquinone oxidoreductase subunit 5 (subunit L)/multisubunit Na+/H+ antiporter MnhA subunit